MNHICNWMVIKNNNGEKVPLSKTAAKADYVNLILDKFIVPKAQKKWQEIFYHASHIEWPIIWVRGLKNN